MNLYSASNQWATRPDDQRFWTLQEMLEATRRFRESAREAVIPVRSLQVIGTDGGDLEIVGQAKIPARMTHWGFGQLARYAGAPADYLRTLPAKLAASNVNYGIQKKGETDKANLLLHSNGSLVMRSITTDSYSRIWDCDVIDRMTGLETFGWRVPPARPCRSGQAGSRKATEQDVLESKSGGGGLSVKVGDMIAPAGLYASDHDCFVFMVNEKHRIADGSPEGLSRGFFLHNSEVANGKALKVTCFLYRHVCGNHIVWDASDVNEIKVVHRGSADRRFREKLRVELRSYAEGKASEDEARIVAAQKVILGANKEEVLDTLFKKLRGELPQKTMELSYDQAEDDAQFDKTINPRSVWGVVQGMTAYSRNVPFADDRNRIDRAAGKVMKMAF